MSGPLRLAMVGGGPGAFIGPVHAMAAALDGRWRLVAGAFSRDEARNRRGADRFGVDPARAHADWRAMLAAEAARPDGARAVAVVTPNHLHLPIARAALEAGLAVISDKPATATLAEAVELADAVRRTGLPYALTHSYAGYPMVRLMRERIAAGAIGPVRKVTAEYSQGWLARPVERGDHRQASWRTDPARSGEGGALGDIGTHAFHLAEYVTGRPVATLFAQVRTVVSGRVLDDDADLLLRFAGGATGVLIVSQVAAGERNELRIKVHGEGGTLAWSHAIHDRLVWLHADGREQVLHAGADGPARLPAGHPEGFVEAFATLYREFAEVVGGAEHPPTLPGIDAGLRGLLFVDAALRSSREERWIALDTP